MYSPSAGYKGINYINYPGSVVIDEMESKRETFWRFGRDLNVFICAQRFQYELEHIEFI